MGGAGYKAENHAGGVGVSLVPEPKLETEGLGVSASQKNLIQKTKTGEGGYFPEKANRTINGELTGTMSIPL